MLLFILICIVYIVHKVYDHMMLYTQDCVFCIHNECIFHILCILQFLIYLKLNLFTLGKPIMIFGVNLINYLVKLHLKCINEYCIRIPEILCILKCVVMIDMKTRLILFWWKTEKPVFYSLFSLTASLWPNE